MSSRGVVSASNTSSTDRWTESREYLRLCHASFRARRYPEALNWLHEAHNLGRDNVFLHAVSHLSYIRFSWKDSDYRHALGHLVWAICSPVMVPLERKKRVEVIGEWTPAPRNVAPVIAEPLKAPIAAPSINASAPAADRS
jgi:hypothetical protein